MKRSFSSLLFLVFILNACAPTRVSPVFPEDSQLITEVKEIDQHLLNNKTDYIVYQGTGVRVAIHSFGKGPKPLSSQHLQFRSITKLFANSTIIDTNEYATANGNISPSGLRTGLLAVPEGSTATIYVPSSLGYGPNGNGSTIPNNAILAYDIELKKVTRSISEQTQFAADTAAIHKYLMDKNITNALYDSSGIWYTVDVPANGLVPDPFYKVDVTYKGTMLASGNVFDQNTLSNQYLMNLIDGFRIGVTLMNVGSTATFYIPSGLGYGTTGGGAIPPNSNLIFQIKLNSAMK